MSRKWVLLMTAMGIAFWPWLIVGFPLALIFEPGKYLFRLPELAKLSDWFLSYFICTLVVYLVLFKIFSKRRKSAV